MRLILVARNGRNSLWPKKPGIIGHIPRVLTNAINSPYTVMLCIAFSVQDHSVLIYSLSGLEVHIY